MSAIKKIICFGLAVSITLGGIYAAPADNTPKKETPKKASLTQKQKKAASFSSIGLVAGIGIGIWHLSTKKVPVLLIGGSKEKRDALINIIKESKHTESGKPHLARYLETISHGVATGEPNGPVENPIDGVGTMHAKLEDWNISSCGADDRDAPSLVQNAKLIIAILDDAKSDAEISSLLNQYRDSGKCVVIEIWDINHLVNKQTAKIKTLEDFIKILIDNYRDNHINKQPRLGSHSNDAKKLIFDEENHTLINSIKSQHMLSAPLLGDYKSFVLLWNRSNDRFVCIQQMWLYTVKKLSADYYVFSPADYNLLSPVFDFM